MAGIAPIAISDATDHRIDCVPVTSARFGTMTNGRDRFSDDEVGSDHCGPFHWSSEAHASDVAMDAH